MLTGREAELLRRELTQSEDTWVRRRFLTFVTIFAVTAAMGFVILARHTGADAPAADNNLLFRLKGGPAIAAALQAFCCTAAGVIAWLGRRRIGRRTLIVAAISLCQLIILFQSLHAGATAQALADALNSNLRGPGVVMTLAFLAIHLFACAIFPFSVRQAALAYYPLAGLMLLGLTRASDPAPERLIAAAVLIVLGLPGIGLAAARRSRFYSRTTGEHARRRLEHLLGELALARRIHERTFPTPVDDGPIRVRFAYEPMAEIGGDMLYIHRQPGRVTVALIDVTGHGVAAALTCNRLFGELRRLLARSPQVSPDELAADLNEYIALTLAEAGIFATAIFAAADSASGRAKIVNAGHPPALLVRTAAPGDTERVDSTCPMLGVLGPAEFDPAPVEITFPRGSSLLLYTDGATELQLPDQSMLGTARLLGLLEGLPGPDRPGGALSELNRLRDDVPLQDDVFVVEIAHTG